jgi:AcrR family transcriptional regulator
MFASICDSASAIIRTATVEGIDMDRDPFFDALRRIVRNWLAFFSTHPVERGIAFAAGNEVDPEAGAAVRSVTSLRFAQALTPLAKGAEARGELRAGVDIDQVIAMVVMVLRHLDKAPYYPHIDPVLGLDGKEPAEVERIALELVDALERAYGP